MPSVTLKISNFRLWQFSMFRLSIRFKRAQNEVYITSGSWVTSKCPCKALLGPLCLQVHSGPRGGHFGKSDLAKNTKFRLFTKETLSDTELAKIPLSVKICPVLQAVTLVKFRKNRYFFYFCLILGKSSSLAIRWLGQSMDSYLYINWLHVLRKYSQNLNIIMKKRVIFMIFRQKI